MITRFHEDAQRLRKKYGTSDPFEVLDAMHVETVYSHVYSRDGFKEYCAILNKTKYVVINGKLKRIEQTVVGAHELAHLVRHKNELKLGAAFKDP